MRLSKKQFIITLVTSSVIILGAVTALLISLTSHDYLAEAIEQVDFELTDRGYEHDDTFELMEKYQDVIITWESTDTVIAPNGEVNTIGLSTDVEVVIVVTFIQGDNEVTKNYTVTVYQEGESNQTIDCIANPNHPTCQNQNLTPDEQKVNLVKTHLVFADTTLEDLEFITTSNGVDISWSTDNNAITTEGIITRSFTESVTVTVTATLTSGEHTDTKVFTITVLQIDAVEEAKNSINLPSEIDENLQLPSTIGDDYIVTVEWSSTSDVISESGQLIRSVSEDLTVTLTATLTYEDDTDTVSFTVTLLQDPTLNSVLMGLTVPFDVIRDINLPSNIDGVDITWSSSNTNYIETNGTIHKQATDVEVTLTATLEYYGYTQNAQFNITLRKEPANQLATPFGFVWIGDNNFFAYAVITESGYTDMMQATFTTPGEDPLVFINTSTGGNFNVLPILDQIANGKTYTVTFIALGDGISYGDSEPSAPVTLMIEVQPLDQVSNYTVTDGLLTWDQVTDAEYYEIYSKLGTNDSILLATVQATDALQVTLPTSLGIYDITITAKATMRLDSNFTFEYIKSAASLIELDAPVISVDGENILSWNAVPNATSYKVTIGEITKTVTETSLDLDTVQGTPGTYTATVIAQGDQVEYQNSVDSNELTVTLTTPTPQVDANGLLWQNNIAGHYSIERPGFIDPDGWVEFQYIVQVYQNGNLVAESTYDNPSNVVHVQIPGQSGIFTGLSAGQYEVHVIMVGNQTTHLNSEPVIFTADYAG